LSSAVERVEGGKALIDLGLAALALSPHAQVHDNAAATDVEDLERIHSHALPGLPHLFPVASHAAVTAERSHVRKDRGDVQLGVLGEVVLHEVELAAVPPLKARLEALEDFR